MKFLLSWRFWLTVVLIIWVLSCAGCAPIIQTEYRTATIAHDPRPILPKINPDEMKCLTDATYQKIYDRNRLTSNYAVYLETLIDTNNNQVPK